MEWKARDLKTAVYWWAQGVHCQESLSASNYGGSEGAYLYLYYVVEALGLAECSKAFLMRVDTIRPGMIRLNTETANDLLRLARSGKNRSIEQVLMELVQRYIIPKKTSTTKVDPNELRRLIRQIEEVASYSRDADRENDVKAIERLAELGDPQALDVLTRATKHILIDIMFAAKEAIEKIKSANRFRDGDLVRCGKCGAQTKVRVFDPGKIALLGPDAMVSMRRDNIALKCQDCGFIICFSCASSQTGSVGVPKCPACNKDGGPTSSQASRELRKENRNETRDARHRGNLHLC